MLEPESPLKSVSLDDLLKANREQFDKIFGVQREELGLLGTTRVALTEQELGSASLAALGEGGQRDAISRLLDETLGSGWSYDVVEHRTENGEITVLCKLSLNGSSKMQFGSARVNGDPEAALSNIDAAIPSAAGDPAVLVPAALSLAEIGDLERAESIAAELSTSLAKSDRAYAGAIRARVAGWLGQPGTGIEFASQALELTDLWLIRFIRGNLYFQAGQIDEAVADLEVCRDRIGEGIAVFLNDRPSFRLLADLDEASAAIGALD